MCDAVTFQRMEPLEEEKALNIGMAGRIALEYGRKIGPHGFADDYVHMAEAALQRIAPVARPSADLHSREKTLPLAGEPPFSRDDVGVNGIL